MEDEKSQIRAQSIAARSAKTASKPQRVKQIAERSSNGGGRGSGKSNGMKKGNFSSEVRKASAGKRKHKGGRK